MAAIYNELVFKKRSCLECCADVIYLKICELLIKLDFFKQIQLKLSVLQLNIQ